MNFGVETVSTVMDIRFVRTTSYSKFRSVPGPNEVRSVSKNPLDFIVNVIMLKTTLLVHEICQRFDYRR